MKKSMALAACIMALVASVMCLGCSSGTAASSSAVAAASSAASAAASSASAQAAAAQNLSDGTYTVKVETDSSMFHVNESKNGTAELTVKDGKMVAHLTLVSKRITNLYAGTADQAQADPDGVIQPSLDKVTYSDGAEEEVYGFDVPVPALDKEFDVAILGEKGSWYDHTVTISNPVQE